MDTIKEGNISRNSVADEWGNYSNDSLYSQNCNQETFRCLKRELVTSLGGSKIK